jgi:hypothetical protein
VTGGTKSSTSKEDDGNEGFEEGAEEVEEERGRETRLLTRGAGRTVDEDSSIIGAAVGEEEEEA